MNDLQSWWDIAKLAGAGGFFVSGPVAWVIWKAYQKELDYGKTRDKETLDVLHALGTNDRDHAKRDDTILEAIKQLEELVRKHLKATE